MQDRYVYISVHSFVCGSYPPSLAPLPPLLSTFTADNQSVAYQYVVSLYWAVSTTANVGYGDIYAHTDLEVGMACICA